jgi:phosphate transport system permease protein
MPRFRSLVDMPKRISKTTSLVLSNRARVRQDLLKVIGHGFLFCVTSVAALAVLFIIFFIARDAIPFFQLRGFKEFFTSARWYPSAEPVEFGALSIFVGSALVTVGAGIVAVPLGVSAAVCLSDVLPFHLRQLVKPVIEVLAAIPSVAYGFFALVVLAPLLQQRGGMVLSIAWWVLAAPLFFIAAVVLGEMLIPRGLSAGRRRGLRILVTSVLALIMVRILWGTSEALLGVSISSGTNALNVSLILGIMALPTIVSVSEDALQAVGRELREGSYALGATRGETLLRTVIPAASSGICAATLLGIMRALGETMVVWMASGNAAQIPEPFYNMLKPVRTLTATIAGDMGEADHVTGSARYHVLFAMGLCLLVFCFASNLVSEWVVRRQRRKLSGAA